MDASDFVDSVQEARKTELSRLGSSKSLFADTDGDLERDPVLRAAAATYGGAADTVGDWAAEGGERVGFLEGIEGTLRDQYETVAAELDGHELDELPAVSGALSAFEGDVERLGALVGWVVVVERKTNQLTGFFTGQADPQTASVFREFGDDFDEITSSLLDALEGRDDADRDSALSAADTVVAAAYDEYVQVLESHGVNPKPVC